VLMILSKGLRSMEKVMGVYEFLDSLLKDNPKGEWKEVKLAIRTRNDHWEIKVLEEKREWIIKA